MISFFNNCIKLIKLLINSKYILQKPDKKKFLIIDGRNKELLFKYINKKDCNILYTRGEFLNLYVAFKCLFNLSYKGIHFSYINQYIKSCDPQLCVTLNHPKTYFYKLKKTHKNLKTIAFQNGHTVLSQKNKFLTGGWTPLPPCIPGPYILSPIS